MVDVRVIALGLLLSIASLTQIANARVLPSVDARAPLPEPERIPGLPSDDDLE